ncbi:MAG: DUF2145 domain-containing protein [Pseudomonadales bacterium]
MRRIILAIMLIIHLPAYAGSQANAKANFTPEQISTFAKDVERYAAAQGARAFIIARVGQDPSKLPKGIDYTHTAVAVYSNITLKNGDIARGYVIHNLYQRPKAPNRSDLVRDYPVDFFWGAKRLTAGITIPSPKVQRALIEALNNGAGEKVHNSQYSVISNPYNNKFQNCTEHTLLVLNSAIYNTTNTQRLYENQRNYFSAQKVHTSRLKLRLGSTFSKGVALSDHKGTVKTATFNSISRYLQNYGLLHQSVNLHSDGTVSANI